MPSSDVNKGSDMSAEQRINQIKAYLCDQFQLSEEQIGEMLPGFIQTLSTHMENMERNLAEDDPIALGKAGHTMKGALLNLGLNDCAELALRIEESGKADDRLTDFTVLVADLRQRISPLFNLS